MTSAVHIPQGGLGLGGSAPVVVGNGGGSVDADVVVEWDFNNDGGFDEAIEDITGRVMAVETLTGRDYPSSLTGVAGPGQMRVACLNDDGALSWFNQASPLNTDPYSLAVGRRLRLRTTDAAPTEPVLLARDRFDRADGNLGTAETGQTWSEHLNGWSIVDGVARAGTGESTTIAVATVDVGTPDQFAQCTIRQCKPNQVRLQGLALRFADSSNYVIVMYRPGTGIEIYDRVAGTAILRESTSFVAWEGMTLGAHVDGDTCTVYVGGAPVLTATVTTAAGDGCGLYSSYNANTGRGTEYDDFHVWDSMPAPAEGVLWTGSVSDVAPQSVPGGPNTAAVSGLGPLSAAAETEVAAPRLPVQGSPTGTLVGDVMSRAGIGWPPVPLDAGDASTGPVSIDDADALTLARAFEETERGFVHETNEGYVGFHAASRRIAATSQAWFSDTPGVGQYRFHEINPLDHRGQIVNRVTAGVTPYAPSPPTRTTQDGTGAVTYTYPGGLLEGELIVLFFASTVTHATEEWLTPLWWVNHREIKAARGLRVYSHVCSGTESGTVTFFANSGASSGLWMRAAYRIPPSWYGSYNSGIVMGDPVPGERPAPIVHGWGRYPTMFIACVAGMGGTGSGMTFSSDFGPPDGYGQNGGNIVSSGPLGTEAGIVVSHKVDVTESEHPTEFFGLDNVDLEESVIFAVRGYNGPHTKQTLENPNNTGGTGVTVTVEDVDSQARHRLIRTHETASQLFPGPNQAGAYGLAVLAEYAQDRPIVSMSFHATVDAAHRAQAIRRRVGDKITLTAAGATGLGVARDMFIEHVHHRITDGGKQWLCTWQLSPA